MRALLFLFLLSLPATAGAFDRPELPGFGARIPDASAERLMGWSDCYSSLSGGRGCDWPMEYAFSVFADDAEPRIVAPYLAFMLSELLTDLYLGIVTACYASYLREFPEYGRSEYVVTCSDSHFDGRDMDALPPYRSEPDPSAIP